MAVVLRRWWWALVVGGGVFAYYNNSSLWWSARAAPPRRESSTDKRGGRIDEAGHPECSYLMTRGAAGSGLMMRHAAPRADRHAAQHEAAGMLSKNEAIRNNDAAS